MSDNVFDIAVVGGGIVGAATFYKLQKAYPELKIILFEKEKALAAHQTGNNSGVIHSGLYYKPGSLKAKNCVNGRHQLVKFAKENKVDHDVCGKVVVATKESEFKFMDQIFENGIANQTEGIEKITGKQVKEIEPFVEAKAGIWVPCTGIVDFVGATNKMAQIALEIQPLSKLALSEEAVGFSQEAEMTKISTNKNSYSVKKLIFCGGLHADRLAKKDGVKIKEKVVGFRGDYYELTDQAKHKVKNLIYPVPNPEFPFLGVH